MGAIICAVGAQAAIGDDADDQAFEAAAIIKDGPFYTREMYHTKHSELCVDEDDLIYNGTLYVSPDHVVPRGITYTHNREQRWLDASADPELDLRLVFEMPETVEFVGLRDSEGLEAKNLIYSEVGPSEGSKPGWKQYVAKLSSIVNAPERTGTHMLYFRTTLPPGGVAQAYYYLAWQGGQQERQAIRIESISIPKVRPPTRFFTGVWHMETGDLKLMCPDFPEDFASLGLNAINLYYVGHWEDDTERLAQFYDLGDSIYTSARDAGLFILYNNFFPWALRSQYGLRDWVRSDVGARALDIEGNTVPNYAGYVLCPSYRGEYYQEALERLRTFSQLKRWPASFFNMDLEIYGGRGRKVCFCDRCVDLFEAWFAKRHPDLNYIDPFALNREVQRPDTSKNEYDVGTEHPLHYEAWVEFKIEKFADMWRGMRDAIAETVGPVRTAPFDDITIADWAAVYPTTIQREDCLYGPYTMRESIQLYAVGAYGPAGLVCQPQFEQYVDLYHRQLGSRRSMYDSPPTSGYGWSGSSVATKPERTKYYLLETAMNGIQGMLLYPYDGLDGKQLAINATVFGSIRLVEDLIVEGERIADIEVTGDGVHARGFRLGEERVVLVGDNYVATDRREAVLTLPVERRRGVYDLLTRAKLGTLTPEDPTIRLTIDGLEDRARFLYVGSKWRDRQSR